MDDDPLIPIEEDGPPASAPALHEALPHWLVLVVDDDEDMHRAVSLALRGGRVEGRPVRLLHAHSAEEARGVIADEEDLAVILLDVVMERDDAGLQLVQQVREELGRSAVRIILCTGQPGYAPELDSIRDYDIDDYKTKSELTQVRLFTAMTTALRAYRQLCMHEALLRGFERVIRASTELSKLHDTQHFAQEVLVQLCGVLELEPVGLICVDQGGAHKPLSIVAGVGRFSAFVGADLDAVGEPAVRQAVREGLAARGHVFAPQVLLYLPMGQRRAWAVYVEVPRPLSEMDRRLLQVMAVNLVVGLDNVRLYDRLVDQAYVDPLLRIPNLNSMLQLLDVGEVERDDRTLALLDIDDFSAFNDALGHDFGDLLLREVAHSLSLRLPHSHIARLGPDIFGVLGPSDEVMPENLQHSLREGVVADGESVSVSATMGLVRLSERCDAGASVLKDAHVALKQAKKHQRGSAAYFSESMGVDARERMRLLASLRQAFDAQHMYLLYQPKVSLPDGQPVGVEALLRWRTAEGHLVQPDRFIPLAEQSGLIGALGAFVLRSACQQLLRLREAGERELVMAINVSQAQLREADFLATLQGAIVDAGVPAEFVEIEVTESMAAEDLELIGPLLAQVRAMGVSVAIDDFGTGFSSLSVLRHLPVQRLKIDRSFIAELHLDDSIARMVITLGHSLGLHITAEGVETEAQRQALCELGCEEGQGWLYAPALNEHDLLRWLRAHRKRP